VQRTEGEIRRRGQADGLRLIVHRSMIGKWSAIRRAAVLSPAGSMPANARVSRCGTGTRSGTHAKGIGVSGRLRLGQV
jgi:hypothetical protein